MTTGLVVAAILLGGGGVLSLLFAIVPAKKGGDGGAGEFVVRAVFAATGLLHWIGFAAVVAAAGAVNS